jgi:hypothetical protein
VNAFLQPTSIVLPIASTGSSFGGILGDLDGMYYPTITASPEDIINDGVDDYLIVNNVFRTAFYELAAIRLT